jgi:hypothetical protein
LVHGNGGGSGSRLAGGSTPFPPPLFKAIAAIAATPAAPPPRRIHFIAPPRFCEGAGSGGGDCTSLRTCSTSSRNEGGSWTWSAS